MSGANGGNGASGVSGTSGANGAAGATGSSGTSGSSGASGSSGTSNAAPSSQACCGGTNNCSVFDGGNSNAVTSSAHSFAAGDANVVCSSNCSAIGSGSGNRIHGGSWNAIGGGSCNTICCGYGLGQSSSNKSVIAGGRYNCIFSGTRSVIAGGGQGTMYGATDSAIISGKTSGTNYTMTVVLSGSSLNSAGDYRTTVAYLSKGGGSFKIAHPDPSKNKTHELWHTFVESPTRGENIYRFKVKTTNCVGVVELPDYYKYLNNNDHVHLSPIDKFMSAYAFVNSTQTQIEVVSNEDGEFDLFLFGTRKDNFMYEHWKGAERLIDDEGED